MLRRLFVDICTIESGRDPTNYEILLKENAEGTLNLQNKARFRFDEPKRTCVQIHLSRTESFYKERMRAAMHPATRALVIGEESIRLMLAAAQRGDVPEVQKFMDDGMNPSVANGVGQTGLHVACLWGNDKCVEALIKAGAQVFSSCFLPEW